MKGWPFGLMASSEVRGRYEVLKQIGEGGFGNVYKARRRDDKVVVALKEVHHAQSSRRELDALLRLSHPNVVKLLDYVQQGSSVVLVLEYVESNLAEVIAAGSLDESAIKGIMVQVLRGLAACHSSMLVHRDLKPSNILVTANGVLKIADFGNARVIQERDLDFAAGKEPERSVAGSELLGSLKSCVYGGLVAEGMPGDASCFVDIRQELKPRTRDDSRVGEETSMLRGEALFVQNSNHFHPQEPTAGLPGRGFQPNARTKGQEVVNGAVGRKGATSQKQSDFFHKLKGFLKKGCPHSEKQEKVADLQGPVAESPPDGVDNEYRQRSGRWLSPVNSALLVFDNKENQGQCVPSLTQSSSLVVNEGEKVESLSGRLQSLDKDLKVPGDRGCQLGQHGSHMSDGRLGDKICSKVKPHLKQAGGMERDVPQKHFGSTISQLQTHAAEAAAELVLVDCSDQSSNVERQAKLRGSAASLMTNNQLMSPEVLVSSAESDALTMRVVGDLNSLEDHGECLGVVEPNILPPSSLFKDSASNVSTSSLLASKGRRAYLPASQCSGHNLSVPSEEELRTVDKLPEHQSDKGVGTKLRGSCCFGMGSCGNKGALDSGRVHTENEGSSEPTSTAEVTYDLTRGQKLSQSCQQPKNKLVSCGVEFLRENSACSLPRTEAGIQIVGFEPTQRRDNAPANAYKTTEFSPTVEAFAGAASGMKGIVQPASTTCGLRHHGEPGNSSKGTRYASPLGAVTGSGNQSLSPVHIGSSGSDDKKSVEDGGSFSLENWDQSVCEARRNLEQGGGVYGLYHNRRGWQGYNSELKCWGVITSKGKIIGQSLSRDMTSRAPRIRGASENARLAIDKDGQRVFFSESQSLVEWDATRKKSPEMGPLSSSERVEKCRTVVPHQNLREPASELRAKQPKGEVGSSSSTSQCTLQIPAKRVLKSMSSAGGGGVQGGTGWISPSGRFDFLSPAAVGYENEEESSNAEFYYPGRLEMEARNGSDWGSPSEPFDFMRVRTVGDQSGSKSSLSDLSNTDGTEFGLQLTADSSLKHWSDVEKESESGQDGWEKASGEWSTDRDGLMGDLEGPHSGSLARSEETRWFGAPELRDSYLEVDGGRSVRGLAGEQGWDEMHQDSPLQLASQGKDASSEAAIQVPANLEKAWVDSARASGRHAEEPRMGLSDDSTSRSGSEDDGDLTNCVGTRWYRAPELLYGATEYGRAVDLWSVGLIFAELLMGAPLFPGLNDIDQLSRVVRFLGSPTESNWPGVSKLPDYDKIFFQDNRPPLSLHDKFPTASKACLSFLEKFLAYNPAARVNAHEALKDDFFTVSPVPAPPHELKLPTRQRKKSNPQQCGEWSEPLSSSSDFELIS